MKRGAILAAARRDTRTGFAGAVILVLLCAGVLAFNWKYVFNFAAGPVPFTAALSALPGPYEWVTASGPFLPTEGVEQTALGLHELPGLQGNVTSARNLAMPLEDHVLIVKVDKEYSGTAVSGMLTPLPARFADSESMARLYPWYVDATIDYRRNFEPSVLGAAIVLPIGVVFTIVTFRSRIPVERYPPISGLKRFGHPSYVIESIEKEFATPGASAYVAPMWIGASWVVRLAPSLQIFKLTTLVAAAYVTTLRKNSRYPTPGVRFWIIGQSWPTTIDMREKEARAVLAALEGKVAGIVQDAAGFDKRWKHDQDGCERDAKARKPLSRSA
ncbi:MAG TPA: hypothetical protein VKB50_26740 [Vicinamibacterales bacterium]|nr:hypothetical protein [Vicinamibacterales bacterium]